MNSDDVVCPFCGEPISRNAKACRHCGSDEKTGWSENTYLDGIDIPDQTEYNELLESEFGSPKRIKIDWKMVVGGLLILCFVILMISGLIK